MPTMPTVFEREILDLSRAALRLEKLMSCSDSVPSAVQYQQILKRLSEFHQMWRKHRGNQQKWMSTLSSMERQLAPIIQDIDELGFSIEQQLQAVSTSAWPRSMHGGLCSLRFAASRILALIFQQIARERASCAPLIHSRKISRVNPPMMVPTEGVQPVERVSA